MSKVIILSSILKPWNEVRIYERMARSINRLDDVEIHVSGTPPDSEFKPEPTIFPHELFATKNRKRSRLKKGLETFRIWKELKPDLIIITTPELIPWAVLLKLFSSVKVIYDVQEHYQKNITFQRVYVGWKKQLLLLTIWIIEHQLGKLMNGYFLAEKSYLHQLPFKHSLCAIVENKTANITIEEPLKDKDLLLFTGIISDYSGIRQAVEIYKKLKANHFDLRLRIAGFSYNNDHIVWLKEEAQKDSSIELIGINKFVDHHIIVESILKASLGIICHEYSELSSERIPTKLYEYSHYQLPFLVQEHTTWSEVGTALGGAIPMNFESPLEEYPTWKDLTSKKEIIFKQDKSAWGEEEREFLDFIQLLIY